MGFVDAGEALEDVLEDALGAGEAFAEAVFYLGGDVVEALFGGLTEVGDFTAEVFALGVEVLAEFLAQLGRLLVLAVKEGALLVVKGAFGKFAEFEELFLLVTGELLELFELPLALLGLAVA